MVLAAAMARAASSARLATDDDMAGDQPHLRRLWSLMKALCIRCGRRAAVYLR